MSHKRKVATKGEAKLTSRHFCRVGRKPVPLKNTAALGQIISAMEGRWLTARHSVWDIAECQKKNRTIKCEQPDVILLLSGILF